MSTNGKSETTHQYNKIEFTAGVILPDAPEGEWDVTFLHNKGKVTPTKNADPMVTFTVRLDSADSEENESYCGTQLPFRFIFPNERDPKKATLVKMTKRNLNDLSSAIGADLNGFIPTPMNDPENELRAFIDAVEGKSCRAWTVHSKNKQTGEVGVELRFSAPRRTGGGGSSRDE